ncbi:MAG TPA: GAF and ANTAR domain-containing protein [Acidimicrobiales bacterium]|nr:GAF and ANTAR domain-containing protein [Acidimicrobiales bacterium]
MSAPTDQRQLAAAFAEISRALLAEPDVQRTLARICEVAVPTVDGCDHAVVTVLAHRRLSTPTASDVTGGTVDAIQFEVGEGPSLEAIREQQTIVADDLATDPRWPRFSRRAVEATGVRSMVAFRMFVADHTMGSLNLYSREPAAFTEESLAVGAILAAHASVALRAAETKESLARLREVMEARELIGQARGILMGRQGISSQAAMEILCRGADRLKLELREMARRVVEGEEDKGQKR